MKITNEHIDRGNEFDWGLTSRDYARFRDIYPREFYDKVIERGLCVSGQKVLDIGTGTGVIPRNLYRYGAEWIGADIEENQITEARRLAARDKMDISFLVSPAESIDFPAGSFDVITVCQCIWYFDQKITSPKFAKMLKKDGRLLILYMAWLPFEDRIAGASEELVLRYNPTWSGAGETRHPIWIPEIMCEHFDMVSHEEYDVMIPFTRETWHGRIRASRGVGASLSEKDLALWDAEHRALLERLAPERFDILHYGAIAELKVKA
ncbi:MAG: class I SAM-dependent methyltransferase [Clostridiales bacterium]|nr:class I SAM-dependent methyltransferase [Clostridiales bacterium]